jgi:hypothetical protein
MSCLKKYHQLNHVEQTNKENATDTRLPHQQRMGLNLDKVLASAFICRQSFAALCMSWQNYFSVTIQTLSKIKWLVLKKQRG